MTTKIIQLKKDTEMWSTYSGSGIPSRMIIVPAGSEAIYNVQVTKAGTYKTAHVFVDGRRYEISCKVSD